MSERSSRQSFLGQSSDEIISRTIVAIIGLGGGGSHIVQQLAHIGFKNFILYDDQTIEDSNLNRLVGAGIEDIGLPKITVAERVIKSLQPDAAIRGFQTKWQANPETLREADVVFGCLDGFAARREIEASTRRYLVPYIDIGMDVFPPIEDEPYRMAGQVILSVPGEPCMQCIGFLNSTSLAREAAAYTAAGPNPQVVWPNGIVASTAVGVAMDMLTNWAKQRSKKLIYLQYDGNANTLTDHPNLPYIGKTCTHYPLSQIGDPQYRAL